MTLTLSGDLSGSATFTNMGNATITAVVNNDSHYHSQVYIPDTRGAVRAPSYYPDRYVSYDFQQNTNTLAGDDSWHVLQTVAKWSSWNASHTQQQIAYTGAQLKHREASSDTAWGGWKTLWDSSNDGSGSGLDADTLDGVNSGSFLRSDADDSISAGVTYRWGATNSAGLVFENSSYPGNELQIGGWSSSNTNGISRIRNSNANLHIDSGGNGSLLLNHYSTGNVQIRRNTVWHAGNDGSGSGLDADVLDGISSGSFLRSDADDYLNATLLVRGDIRNETAYRDHGVYGSYDSNKTNHIWSMGSAYRNHTSGSNFGNLYGMSYKHTNNGTGGTMAGGHQAVFCNNGTPGSAISFSGGIWTSGNITAYSDRRVKTNIERIPNALDKVCQLNGYTFDRTDLVVDDVTGIMPETRQTGVIAQEVLEILPEAVTGTEEGHYSVAYGNMVGLPIESIKELKAEVDELKTQLKNK